MDERSREIRIALVLYGGVSLAVYENGVTRCFYDLVRKRGVFSILLEFLDSDATVDVVAGTSAGGINGLMLAAALENGSEFSATADLWRKDGDFGKLLRGATEADKAISLLKGESYYQKQLVNAFEALCAKGDPDYEGPGEMDIFITGTDLDGRILQYWDELNQKIREKTHRTVFHLKHRPGRKWLGLFGQKTSDEDAKNQAWILSTISRITSTFPVAFPPVRLDKHQFPDKERRDVIKEALAACAGRVGELNENNSFVDGGVLDNKPFGPVLNAIFYRMPTRMVKRHLFYVEPDPNPFSDAKPNPEKHTPLNVAVSALTTIPSHESIHGDLDQLKKHNERIAWVSQLTKQVLDDKSASADVDSTLYHTTRIESLARALLLESDGAPSASDRVADKKRMELLEPVRTGLSGLADRNLKALDALDVNFHIRRVFRMLYEYSHDLSQKRNIDGGSRTAMSLLGRIIKALKLIRSQLIRFRKEIIESSIKEAAGDVQMAVQRIYGRYRSFLAVEAEHWSELISCLNEATDLSLLENKEKKIIPSRILSDTLVTLNEQKANQFEAVERATNSMSILERLSEKALEVVNTIDGSDDRFFRAATADQILYPIEFSAGIHELDRIRLTRISPRDAQKGLSKGSLESKVTGEDFAHFSAFLRRDWRSNDILRGRIDGICQIFSVLLDEKAMEPLRHDPDRFKHLFTPERLKKSLPRCPEKQIDNVTDAWDRFRTVRSQDESTLEPSQKKKAENFFVNALIEATQFDAFMEDVKGISKDVIYQETVWGRKKGLKNVDSETVESLIDQEASTAAHNHVSQEPPEQLWKWFNGIGSQKVLGEKGAVPYHILGEYVTRAYLLLWGMLGITLGENRSFLKGKVRLFFRTPVRIMHDIIFMLRRQFLTASLLIATIIAVLIAFICFSFCFAEEHRIWGTISGIAGLLFVWILPRLTPETKKRTTIKVILIAVLSAALTALLVWGIMQFIV